MDFSKEIDDQTQYLSALEKEAAIQIIKEHLYQKDPIFKELVSKITPPVIYAENKEFIDGFVDSLVNLSPVSVNMSDVFYKQSNYYDPIFNNPEKNKIEGIQNQINKTFLADFWNVFEYYSKNYIVKQYMEDYIQQYETLGNIDLSMDFQFFSNKKSLFTEDKFLAGNDFFIKKGTDISVEYAYKSAWKANVEGIFREDYHFELNDNTTEAIVSQGNCINPADINFTPNPNWNPLPPGSFIPPTGFPDQEPFCDDVGTCSCTEAGKAIGTWLIASSIGGIVETKKTFYYEMIGSMLPIYVNTIVKDLAHPVGFDFNYTRQFATFWQDHFNLTMRVRADSVMVKTLCTGGDCSKPSIDYYSTSDGTPSITNSYLVEVKEDEATYGPFINFEVHKYIFKNGQFLLEYVNDISDFETSTDYKTYIEYFDNDFSNLYDYILDSDFEDTGDWLYESRWSIIDGKAILSGSGSSDLLRQPFTFYSDTRYVVEINILDLDGEILLKFGDTFEKKITSAGYHILRFTNGDYYTDEVSVQDTLGSEDTYCEIDFLKCYQDIPKKTYDSVEHANVMVERFTRLPPIITTFDRLEITSQNKIIDNLNTDLSKVPDSKYPIIGNNISIGYAGSNNSLYAFTIGCYDPNDGVVYPPYESLDGCCQANIPYNPSGTCIYAQLILNNPDLTYIEDKLSFDIDTPREKHPLLNVQGFDSNWTIVSGNATISNGILSQDGSEESVVERYMDICPYDYDIFYVKYMVEKTGTGSTVKMEYVNYDDTILASTETGVNVLEWGWMIEGSSCDNINKVKLRITLPVGYSIPMKNIEIYKY